MHSLLVPCSSYGVMDMILGRMKYDSHNGASRRSRSNHCQTTCFPTSCPTLAPKLVSTEPKCTQIEICRRSRCLMVWRAMVIHSTFRHSGRRTTSSSLIAFERSIEAGLESPTGGCKLKLQRRPKTNVRGQLHAIPRHSRVSEHLATSSVIPPDLLWFPTGTFGREDHLVGPAVCA